MCGLAGFSLATKTKVDAHRLTANLALGIERRGPHATGIAWPEDGTVWYDKAPITARRYVRNMPITPTAKTAIIHTRYATGGDPKVNVNNHPHSLPGITGIHNGVLRPGFDREVYDMLGVTPDSQCDSEAIFALLAYSGLDRLDALSLVEGDATVAWLETDAPDVLHLARLSGRPLTAAQTVTGSFLFSSTDATMRDGIRATPARIVWQEEVPEFTYMRVRAGVITDVERFRPNTRRRSLVANAEAVTA